MAPGFFGKVPARGDFLARRVPRWPGADWEEWLASFTTAARNALGEAWPDDWLTAPLWHFRLGKAVAPPHGAAGVLVASADRVGRLFPFTLVGPADPDAYDPQEDWSRKAESLVLAALEDDFDPDNFDASLQALGAPWAVEGPDRPAGAWAIELKEDWPAGDADWLNDPLRPPPAPAQSWWWCRGSERLGPTLVRTNGLPGPAMSAAMITGLFDT